MKFRWHLFIIHFLFTQLCSAQWVAKATNKLYETCVTDRSSEEEYARQKYEFEYEENLIDWLAEIKKNSTFNSQTNKWQLTFKNKEEADTIDDPKQFPITGDSAPLKVKKVSYHSGNHIYTRYAADYYFIKTCITTVRWQYLNTKKRIMHIDYFDKSNMDPEEYGVFLDVKNHRFTPEYKDGFLIHITAMYTVPPWDSSKNDEHSHFFQLSRKHLMDPDHHKIDDDIKLLEEKVTQKPHRLTQLFRLFAIRFRRPIKLCFLSLSAYLLKNKIRKIIYS